MARLLPTAMVAVVLVLALGARAGAAAPGTTTLIDRPSGLGALPFDGNNDTGTTPHSLSGDGRFVVISSAADALSPTDENDATNVFRVDRTTGEVAQVNTTSAGTQPAAGSVGVEPSISQSGRFVAFFSTARLDPAATGSAFYVKDMQTGELAMASRSTGRDGAQAPFSFAATISGDGRSMAFTAIGAVQADNATG